MSSPRSDDHLDAELADLFDAPDPPPSSSPPPPASRRTIVHALVASKHRLTGHAAQLASEASALAASAAPAASSMQPARAPIAHAMLQRRRSSGASSPRRAAREERARRARAANAFRVLGAARTEGAGCAAAVFSFVDRRFANMALREAPMDADGMQAVFEHARRVDVAEIRELDEHMRGGKLGEFVVFGCLVKKHSKKETKAGGRYAVWSLCNMPLGVVEGAPVGAVAPPPTVVTLLLFEEAFEAFHTRVEGAVFALRKPTLLPPRGCETRGASKGNAEWSGHCLKVSKRDSVIPLGVCKDFGLCSVERPNMGVCGKWFDASRMEMCAEHSRKRRRRLTDGNRMDINNAERPGFVERDYQNAKEANNISKLDRVWYGREGSGDGQPEQEDDLGKYRRKTETALAGKLNASRMSQPVKAESLASIIARGDAARRQSSGRRGLLREGVSRLTAVPAKPKKRMRLDSVAKRNEVVQRGAIQKKYNDAVDVLVGLGFLVCPDGSLVPPPPDKLTILLRTSTARLGPGIPAGDARKSAADGTDAEGYGHEPHKKEHEDAKAIAKTVAIRTAERFAIKPVETEPLSATDQKPDDESAPKSAAALCQRKSDSPHPHVAPTLARRNSVVDALANVRTEALKATSGTAEMPALSSPLTPDGANMCLELSDESDED